MVNKDFRYSFFLNFMLLFVFSIATLLVNYN